MLFKPVLGKLDNCWGVHRVYEWVQLVTKHYKVAVSGQWYVYAGDVTWIYSTSRWSDHQPARRQIGLMDFVQLSMTTINVKRLEPWLYTTCYQCNTVQLAASQAQVRYCDRRLGVNSESPVSIFSPIQWKLKDAKLSYWIYVWYLMRIEPVSFMYYQRQI